jgi:hypothetical protein
MGFTIHPLTVWFSIKTPIAFRIDGQEVIMVERDKYTNRSKSHHFNLILKNNIVKRVTKEEFEELWKKQVQINLDRLKPC